MQRAAAVDAAELAMMDSEDDRTAMAYAQALADWGDAGGYAIEVLWDTCTTAALGLALDRCQYRMVRTLSGGEQKRLVLEALLRGSDEVLLLDEPDNYLDVPGKRWLEEALLATHQDGVVRQPRPRAARPHREPPDHDRGALRLGARRWIRLVPRGAAGQDRAAR